MVSANRPIEDQYPQMERICGKRLRPDILWVLTVVVFISCASGPTFPVSDGNLTDDGSGRANLVAGALGLLGQKPNATVTVNNRMFVLDCIGTVSAAYWSVGFDIQRDFPKYQGNGVSRLYQCMKDWNALHALQSPKIGDIVFWSNTYDRNGNGIDGDDGLTHAGLVVEVEEDGTVHYLHESYSRGVVISFFNLRHPTEPKSPDGKIWNSPMYLGSNYDKPANPPHWLSGDLWSAFGDADRTMQAVGQEL